MNSQFDFKAVLSSHAMVWRDFPRTWFEGPFLGNGETGVSAYFDKDNNLYLNVGNTSVYDNRDNSGQEQDMLYLTPRLPLGGFRISAPGGFTANDMKLSLYDGELTADLTHNGGTVKTECFTVEGQKAFFFRWREQGCGVKAAYEPVPAMSPRQYKMLLEKDARVSLHYDDPKPPRREEKDGVVTHIQPKFRGGEYRVNYKIFDESSEHTLVCLIENYEIGETPAGDAPGRVNALYGAYEAEKQKLHAFWNSFYTKSYVSLDDKKLEQFYWIQLYKCAAATRKGYHVFDTAGPWLGQYTAWPAGWWNLNVELNYSPLYPANHLEIGESLLETIENGLDTLRENVPEKYRNGRFCTIGRNTTSTLKTDCGIPGECTRPIELEVGNLVWALHNCYVHLRSACDDDRLKNFLFPVLKGATEYIVALLKKEEDGLWHLPPTTSPEYKGISEDCAYNMSLLRWGLLTLQKLNDEFDLKDENAALWQEVLNELAPLPADPEQGIMIGRDYPLAESHRHYSHLLAFYPLHIMDENDPAQRELIEKSIAHWQSMPKGLQGYSCTGSASMYAYLGNGNMALKKLERLFEGYIRPNTMYHEDFSPVLETPPAAARSILDMLMISVGDEIRVFTGTPDSWQNVSFGDLLAENGCLVSAKRENGQTASVSLTAKRACRVKLICAMCPAALPEGVVPAENGLTVTLNPGQTVTLTAR